MALTTKRIDGTPTVNAAISHTKVYITKKYVSLEKCKSVVNAMKPYHMPSLLCKEKRPAASGRRQKQWVVTTVFYKIHLCRHVSAHRNTHIRKFCALNKTPLMFYLSASLFRWRNSFTWITLQPFKSKTQVSNLKKKKCKTSTKQSSSFLSRKESCILHRWLCLSIL